MRSLLLLFGAMTMLVTGGYGQGNWQLQQVPVSTTYFDVYFIDANNGWAAGNVGTILQTTNGGDTWVEQTAPPTNQYFCVYFADALHGWAGGDGGTMIRTTDGGETWIDGTTSTSRFRYDVCFVGTDSGWVVGGDHGVYPSFTPHREIFFTSDGGATWNLQYGRSGEWLLNAVYFLDNMNGYAVGEFGGVLHTTNGGATWVEETTLSSYHLRDVVFINENTGWILGYYLGLPHASSVFKTTDGGATWSEQMFGVDESFSGMAFGDALNGWIVGGIASISESLIMRTTDGGETWTPEQSPTDQYLLKVFAFGNNGWAAGLNGAMIASREETVCNDVQTFRGRCRNDLLQARVIFTTDAYNGQEAVFTVDGADKYAVVVQNQRATLSVSGFSSGDHIIELTNPAGCADPISVRCRQSLAGEPVSDTFFDPESQLVESLPVQTELIGNYPNPFNPSTTIRYALSAEGRVVLTVHNILGEEVARLVDEVQPAGYRSVVWNGRSDAGTQVASGMYLYRLSAGDVIRTGKMLLMK